MNLQQLFKKTDLELYANVSYYQNIASNQKLLLQYFGANTDINKITSSKIAKFIQHLKLMGLEDSTINNKLTYLRTNLKYAHRESIIKTIPYIPSLTIKHKPIKTYKKNTVLEILRYLKKQNETELRIIVLLSYYTGIRINNILTLEPEQLENNYIRLWENKTHYPYSVPIKKRLQPLLKDFKGFTHNYQQCYYKLKKMKEALNIKNFKIHTFRHTYCTRLLENQIPIATTKALMGHKSINTTMLYAHISNIELEKAIQKI